MAMSRTGLSAPVPTAKVGSNVPSGFSRAMFLAATPTTFLKSPPMMMPPSDRTATANTSPSTPAPMANVLSYTPSALSRDADNTALPSTKV